jgi:hypothetical protein
VSTLTPSEALWSYILYLHPKLTYPLPCSSLTPAQCRFIQAPILAALLPKLYLNRHTPRSLLFSTSRLGGLALPDYYIDQGYGRLRLLIGHLKLQDDNGKLIQVLLTHLQLHLGSSMPVFYLPFAKHERWIEGNWLTSLWQLLSTLTMKLDIENYWVPLLARVNDIMLMDEAIRQSFTPRQLQQLTSVAYIFKY